MQPCMHIEVKYPLWILRSLRVLFLGLEEEFDIVEIITSMLGYFFYDYPLSQVSIYKFEFSKSLTNKYPLNNNAKLFCAIFGYKLYFKGKSDVL